MAEEWAPSLNLNISPKNVYHEDILIICSVPKISHIRHKHFSNLIQHLNRRLTGINTLQVGWNTSMMGTDPEESQFDVDKPFEETQ